MPVNSRVPAGSIVILRRLIYSRAIGKEVIPVSANAMKSAFEYQVPTLRLSFSSIDSIPA